jgi:hypothetical protein
VKWVPAELRPAGVQAAAGIQELIVLVRQARAEEAAQELVQVRGEELCHRPMNGLGQGLGHALQRCIHIVP